MEKVLMGMFQPSERQINMKKLADEIDAFQDELNFRFDQYKVELNAGRTSELLKVESRMKELVGKSCALMRRLDTLVQAERAEVDQEQGEEPQLQ